MRKEKNNNGNVKKISQIPIINTTAAGIDVSDSEMMVAYPINSEQLKIESFGCFTCDLQLLAESLQRSGITTVAMESTGVYWVSLFLLLQEYGFEVNGVSHN